jgi:hypothetical protein
MTLVATQEGEIPFSAHNSIGWRQIVEKQHETATLTECQREHGRHKMHDDGNFVPIQCIQGVDAQVLSRGRGGNAQD